MWGEVFRVA